MLIKDLHDPYKMQGQTQEAAAFTFRDGSFSGEASAKEIVTEHKIAVFVNDRLAAQLVCTPSDLTELVIGRLLTEQIIQSTDEVRELYICERASRARVFLKDPQKILNPHVEQSPTCCSDNHVYLCAEGPERPAPFREASWHPEKILKTAAAIRNGSKIYRTTHGTHGGFLIRGDEVIYQCEDIGRHNAIDKAIGYLAIQHIDPLECMLYSTGRASADMIRKAVRARVPVFLSKAAPTSAAVEMAKSFYLTLACNITEESFDLYSSEFPSP